MEHHQQQTEKIIVEMLEFLDSSSEEENDVDKLNSQECIDEVKIIKDFNDNIIPDKTKMDTKRQHDTKKGQKFKSKIAKELKKLKQQFPIWNTKEIFNIDKSDKTNDQTADWKLETNCRLNSSNSFTQEIHRAIYHDTTGHPPSGSADYYQAAQNYVLYGKHFLDFPENLNSVINNKNTQNPTAESHNLNFGHCLYSKPSIVTSNNMAPLPGVLTTAAAASAAAYYQICNSMQAQARPTISNNPGNSTAYGIFLGNKVTYVAASPTSPSLIYNQHSTTTTNFVSNSLANAALATSPTILYTNPMLTTTTQQYLNTFFKETQFLGAAALASNSTQSATMASNVIGTGLYERLIYAQMLQQQIYQTQQAAAVAAMFQHKQRAAAVAATIATVVRQSNNGVNVVTNSNRSSPQHLNTVPTTATSSSNGVTLNSSCRQARNSPPLEAMRIKQQTSTAVPATGNTENIKSASE